MLDHQAHGDTASMPAAGDESVPLSGLRRDFVDVKGLRIEFRREIDDRRFVDAIGAGSKNLALEKIGEFHDRCIRNPLLARASPGARAGLVSWHYAARRKKQSRRALCQASPVAGRGCAASVGTRSA